MTILADVLSKARNNIEIVLCGSLLLLLLLRNPLSIRTQIANFAPAPDAFYYVVPARSLAEGKGPFMVREGRSFSPIVPPLYSFALAPIFLLRDDPRMFYIVNVILVLTGFLLFAAIAKLLFPNNRLLLFLLLFLFASNNIFYWFSTLAMAENLVLPLSLACVLILLKRPSAKMAVLMGIFAVFLYATKYVSLPLTVSFVLLYLFKLQRVYGFKRSFRKLALLVICSAEITFLVFGMYGKIVLRTNDYFDPLVSILSVLKIKVNAPRFQTLPVSAPQGQQVQWFSLSNAVRNFHFYYLAATGRSIQVLWEWTPLLGTVAACLGWLGLILAFFSKQRFESLSIFLLIISQTLLALIFFTPDGRYVMHIIPLLLIGLGFCLSWLDRKFKRGAKLILLIFIAFSVLTSAVRLKSDVMLNLRYAESPWWYIAVLELNKSIDIQISQLSASKTNKEPYVITSLYPYLVDFYSTGKYRLLPMSPQQEFRSYKEQVWGNFDYNNLEAVYLKLIADGHPLYIASYGIGHDETLIQAFDYLQKAFKLEEVSTGCYNLCKVYRVWPTGKPLPLKGGL